MKVVVPYVPGLLDDDVVEALREQAPHAEFVDISATDTSYWRLLVDLWADCAASGDDLCVIEQDVVVISGTLEILEACPHGWCSCPPSPPMRRPWHAPHRPGSNGWLTACLTCNRWTAAFMAQHPGTFANVALIDRHWASLDCYSIGRLRASCHCHTQLRTEHRHRHADNALGDDRIASLIAYRESVQRHAVEA